MPVTRIFTVRNCRTKSESDNEHGKTYVSQTISKVN